MKNNYPNAMGEDYRDERDRLLDTGPNGKSDAKTAYALLLHAHEVRWLRTILDAVQGRGDKIDNEIAASLKYEVDGYKLRALRLDEA